MNLEEALKQIEQLEAQLIWARAALEHVIALNYNPAIKELAEALRERTS